jgi:hypothetical protein
MALEEETFLVGAIFFYIAVTWMSHRFGPKEALGLIGKYRAICSLLSCFYYYFYVYGLFICLK